MKSLGPTELEWEAVGTATYSWRENSDNVASPSSVSPLALQHDMQFFSDNEGENLLLIFVFKYLEQIENYIDEYC